MPTPTRFRTLAWASFDLANTIFSMNILSLYFPLWVIRDKGGSDLAYGVAVSLSLLVSGVSMPFLGALSDHLQRRIGFLIPVTLLCIISTASLAFTQSLMAALFVFGVAHIMYQLGLVFYDAMLPEVSQIERLGRTSGLGISLGYIGTLVGLFLVRPFVLRGGHQGAFFPTAVFFLLFSLPCFLWVKDVPIKPTTSLSLFREGLFRIRKGMDQVRKHPPLRGLVWVYFFAFLGIQPVVYFMSVYAQRVIGLDDQQILTFYFIATSFTILGSYLWGILADTLGPKRTLALSLWGWMLGLGLALVSFNRTLFFCVGPLVGIAMGGSWVSLRVLAVLLSPKEHLGQILGFLGFFGRLASVLGPLFWGGTIWIFRAHLPTNYRIAVGELILFLGLSLVFLTHRVPRGSVEP